MSTPALTTALLIPVAWFPLFPSSLRLLMYWYLHLYLLRTPTDHLPTQKHNNHGILGCQRHQNLTPSQRNTHHQYYHGGLSQGSLTAIPKAVTLSLSPTRKQHGASPHRRTIIRLLHTRISPSRFVRITQQGWDYLSPI